MKINKILVALSFFMVILCQIASARNIIERDMGANKGDLMQNFNSVLGNLMDWSNVHLENLLSDESLWSMVRR